jgi:hypothetical protein
VSRTEPYDQYADECRKLASTMRNPEHKKQLQEMADAWAAIAKERAKKNRAESSS